MDHFIDSSDSPEIRETVMLKTQVREAGLRKRQPSAPGSQDSGWASQDLSPSGPRSLQTPHGPRAQAEGKSRTASDFAPWRLKTVCQSAGWWGAGRSRENLLEAYFYLNSWRTASLSLFSQPDKYFEP